MGDEKYGVTLWKDIQATLQGDESANDTRDSGVLKAYIRKACDRGVLVQIMVQHCAGTQTPGE